MFLFLVKIAGNWSTHKSLEIIKDGDVRTESGILPAQYIQEIKIVSEESYLESLSRL